MKRNHWLSLSIVVPLVLLLLAAATAVSAQGPGNPARTGQVTAIRHAVSAAQLASKGAHPIIPAQYHPVAAVLAALPEAAPPEQAVAVQGTATSTPCPGGSQTFQGAITTSDPTHVDYLDLSSAVSTIGRPKICRGVAGDAASYHYDTYSIPNPSGSPLNLTVTINAASCGTGSDGLWALAYLDSYNPANLCATYLGDAGSTSIQGGETFSVTVPAGATLIVELEEYFAAAGCGSYTVTVSGLPCQGATPTVTPAVTPCPVQFSDVPTGSTFYDFIRCLACRGIVGGYPCGGPGEPCPGTYFRPSANVTRGQVSKIVAAAAGFADPIPSTRQTFEDIAPSSTFWSFIERLSAHGAIGGYPCGATGEPCVAPNNRPYFRPANNVTRGQLAKIVAIAAGYTDTPTSQTFADVPPTQTFYLYIERLSSRGTIGGYPCGGTGEPCVAPGNRPYFRPANTTTRGQLTKLAANTFLPNCQTP